MDDFKEDTWNPRRYFRGLLTDENETEAPSAFRSYLGIVPSAPKNFTEFSRRVNHFMEMEPFSFKNPIKQFSGYKNIRIEAAYLYDAVMMYAHVIRDILQEYFWSAFSTSTSTTPSTSSGSDGSNSKNDEQKLKPPPQQRLMPSGISPKLAIRHRRDHGAAMENARNSGGTSTAHASFLGSVVGDKGTDEAMVAQQLLDENQILAKIRDGREVSRRLRNIRYNSATGHETKMDENGDAEGNFTLVALKNKNGEFGLHPVGFFMRSIAQLPVIPFFIMK